MRILIEGQSYLVVNLKEDFNDSSFFNTKGDSGVIDSVGYYYSAEKNKVVYMLPKVFMKPEDLTSTSSEDNEIKCQWEKKYTIFKKSDNTHLTLKELYYLDKLDGSIKHETKYEWIRHITISFYNSLFEFKRRKSDTKIINPNGISNEINTNIGDDEYTYLDLVLSFTNFYKKNKSFLLFKHIEQITNQTKKPKWEKTIRKSIPIIDKNKSPIYINIRNKKTIIDTEEELLIFFFSILNHFKEENNLNFSIDKSYKLIKGEAFKNLQSTGLGLAMLKKIKYKYFSDTMRRAYKLCELYFDSTDTGSIKKRNEEFLSFKKYNIVFEDMVDKLLTEENNLDAYDKKLKKDEISIKKLKNNDDGKIIDHLFEYEGLIDTLNIFYIGDSKYYKPGNLADKLSTYKQFTYAKNIVQFNIDLFNEKSIYASKKIKYRDEMTEGYNITPNFLLYGIIPDHEDFANDHLEPISTIKHSYHWKTRLFDRDSLFICQYQINYLFVLDSYTEKSESSLVDYRKDTKDKFRKNFIDYFENNRESNFTFYKLEMNNLKQFVNDNFKILNGKCFSLNEETTILVAIHHEEKIEADKNGVESLIELIENINVINKYNIKKTTYIFKKPIEYKLPYLDNENNTPLNIAADKKEEYDKKPL
jgi:hypothetical protein